MRKNILLTLLCAVTLNFACTQKASVTNSAANTTVSNRVVSNKPTAAETPAAENARLQAKSCIEAQYQADAVKYADCFHQEIVKSQGGKEKFLASAKKNAELIGKMTYSSLDVSAPTEIKNVGQAMVAVVPFKMTRENFSGENETSSDYLVGVSEDEGKTWKFAVSSFTSPLEKAFPAIKELTTPQIKVG